MNRLLHLVCLIFLLHSCKESEDEISPLIVILAPIEGETIVMPDTISVTARVEDNERIEFINFGLLDANLNAVGERVSVGNIGNPEEFSLSLEVTSLDIENGIHYLEVFASDGSNDEREFVEVNIIAIPKEYQGVVFNQDIGLNDQTIILKVDGSSQVLHTSTGQDSKFAVNSRLNTLSVFDISSNSLTNFGITSEIIEWDVSDVLQGNEMLVQILNDPFSLSTRLVTDEPRIINYNKFGSVSGEIALKTEWEPIQAFVEESEIWLASSTPSGYRVSKLFKATGFELDNFNLSERPLFISRLNEEQVVVVDDLGDLWILNSFSGGQFTIPVADTGEINSLVVVDGTAYFTSSTGLYRFSSGSFQAPIIYSSNDISGLTFDDVNQRLIIAEGSAMKFFLLNPFQNVGVADVGGNISSPTALFNK